MPSIHRCPQKCGLPGGPSPKDSQGPRSRFLTPFIAEGSLGPLEEQLTASLGQGGGQGCPCCAREQGSDSAQRTQDQPGGSHRPNAGNVSVKDEEQCCWTLTLSSRVQSADRYTTEPKTLRFKTSRGPSDPRKGWGRGGGQTASHGKRQLVGHRSWSNDRVRSGCSAAAVASFVVFFNI